MSHGTPTPLPVPGRRKIWEHRDYQCTIVGTCLSLNDLARVARKANLDLPSSASDFEVHGTFVGLCRELNRVSKLVNKLLDRKHAGAVRRFSRARTEEDLAMLWSKAKKKGDIPGPLWALMSHPQATPALLGAAFGDVHMLSHLVGAANQADIRRLSAMEERNHGLRDALRKVSRNSRRKVKNLEAENGKLKERIRQLEQAGQALNAAVETAQRLGEQKEHIEAMSVRIAMLEGELDQTRGRVRRLQGEIVEHKRNRSSLTESLAEVDAERDFLEQELVRLLERLDPSLCDKQGTGQCPGPKLCGRRILYVGGRTNLVSHYRELVERNGGRFLHHDGGVEDSRARLHSILSGADAVVCPVDCVSHDACLRIKQACKQTMKPLVMLRSSGLSSLARSLDGLGTSGMSNTLQLVGIAPGIRDAGCQLLPGHES